MAVRHPGDEDRPTVDLGPRSDTEPALPATDLGDGDDAPPTQAGQTQAGQGAAATRTLTPDAIHGAPTQNLPRRSQSESAHTKYTTTSPVEAMRLEELARGQIFLKVAIVTCVMGAFVAFLTGGDPIALRVVLAGCAITTIGSVWVLQIIRRDVATYTARKILVPGAIIAVGAFGGVYYWGIASPVAAMITYGIYYFCTGSDRVMTTAMWMFVSIVHGALGILIITGVIADRGIIRMASLPTLSQVGLVSVIEFLYLITFLTARLSQRVTLDVVSRLEQAVRGMAQREALLAEARAELERALKIGGPGRFTDQVVGSFRLGVLIGRGGMGEVYEAHSVTDRREAAVKLLHHGTLGDPTHVARFIREAQVAARLDCPNVVRVLEVGTTGGEIPFIAMERLRGYDLAAQLRRQRKLSLPDAALVADHIATGLEAARAAGIVHRDLKPHNVFYSDGWKILDFGVSKAGGSGTLTKGHVVGTPAYMAPEQARGEDVDHRADVYSLAAILYRCVTGHPAFTGKDVPTTLYDVVYRVPTQPSILAALPSDIDRVLAIGLCKDPRDRFATALELAQWFTAAVTESLSPEQRRRADEIAGKAPWGTRP